MAKPTVLEKSPFPVPRPRDNMRAPDRSPLPRRRPDTQMFEEHRRDFGDLEFQASMRNHPSSDLLARLGMRESFGDNRSEFTTDPRVAASVNLDTDEFRVSPYYNSEAVWNHEFRHKGLDIIFNMVKDDPEGKYDSNWNNLVRLLNRLSLEDADELAIELFDFPEHSAGQTRAGEQRTMEETFSEVNGLREEFKYQAIGALSKLALDILEDKYDLEKLQDPLKRETEEQRMKRGLGYSSMKEAKKGAFGWLRSLFGGDK